MLNKFVNKAEDWLKNCKSYNTASVIVCLCVCECVCAYMCESWFGGPICRSGNSYYLQTNVLLQ